MSRKKAYLDPHPEAHLRLISGIVDEMLEQPEAQSAFEEWYAKAKKATPAKGRKATANYTWTHARLSRLIRGFGFPPPANGELIFVLEILRRFREQAAARGLRRPSRIRPSLTEIIESEPLGEQFQFTILADWPISRVRTALQDDFRKFVARVRARIRAVEKSRSSLFPRKRGLPASAYEESLRRYGRWLFLVATERKTVNQLADAYHEQQPKQHIRQQQVYAPDDKKLVKIAWGCDNCVRTVRLSLAKARKLLSSIPPIY